MVLSHPGRGEAPTGTKGIVVVDNRSYGTASLTLFRRAGFVECGRKREWRRTPDGWKISATGYQRTYDATLSLKALDFTLNRGDALA